MRKLAHALYSRIDLVVLLICLSISYFGWQYGLKNDHTADQHVEDVKQNIYHTLTEEVNNVFTYLEGVRGLYLASKSVEAAELTKYLEATSYGRRLSGLLKISYVQIVPRDEQLVASLVVAKQDNSFVVTDQNLPIDASNHKAIDQIMAGSSVGIVYINKISAIDSLSGSGWIIALPIIDDGELTGVISGLITSSLIDQHLQQIIEKGWEYRWIFGDETVGNKIIDKSLYSFPEVVEISIDADYVWRIELYMPIKISMLWTFVLSASMLFSFLIYIVVYSLTSANQRGEAKAREITRNLEKYKLALDSASNHIVITDNDGVVLYANQAAQDMTGYSKEEIIGNNPKLWGGLMDDAVYKMFWQTIKTDKKMYKGLFTNKRKNGEQYFAQATVSPILDEQGNLVGFVGVEEDVTDELRIKNEKSQALMKLSKFNDLMVGRELKMAQMKKEIVKLKGQHEK